MKLVVIYNYYEESRERDTHLSYIFFMKHGYYSDSNIDYVFVINGICTINLIRGENIHIIRRDNLGFDFAAYGFALNSLKRNYDYYFFLNSSVRGPFIVPYCPLKWYEIYINLFKENVKAACSTIDIMVNNPVIQTYAFMLDYEALEFLIDKVFNKIYHTFIDVIVHQEIKMTDLLLENGWNINSLVPEQMDVNWLNRLADPKYARIDYKDDLLTSGNLCNGRDLHPYELIFIKTNRNLSIDALNSLTNYYLSS